MKETESIRTIEGMEDFSEERGNNCTTSIYDDLRKNEDGIKSIGDKCSDFFYISCLPFDNSFNERKNVPGIYQILKRYAHTANGMPLKILIGKFNDDCMQKAKKATEEYRARFESEGYKIKDPYPYFYIVGYFGGSAGRGCEDVINEIKKMYPDKFKVIKPEL